MCHLFVMFIFLSFISSYTVFNRTMKNIEATVLPKNNTVTNTTNYTPKTNIGEQHHEPSTLLTVLAISVFIL